MYNYFKLPTGYSCLQRNGDSIYAYSSNYQVRDTFELDNFVYIKVATSSNSYGYSVNSCLPSDLVYLIPSSFAPFVFLSCSILVSLIISGLFYVFKR